MEDDSRSNHLQVAETKRIGLTDEDTEAEFTKLKNDKNILQNLYKQIGELLLMSMMYVHQSPLQALMGPGPIGLRDYTFAHACNILILSFIPFAFVIINVPKVKTYLADDLNLCVFITEESLCKEIVKVSFMNRLGFTIAIYFIFLTLALSWPVSKRDHIRPPLHAGFWAPKLLFICLVSLVTFTLPPGIFDILWHHMSLLMTIPETIIITFLLLDISTDLLNLLRNKYLDKKFNAWKFIAYGLNIVVFGVGFVMFAYISFVVFKENQISNFEVLYVVTQGAVTLGLFVATFIRWRTELFPNLQLAVIIVYANFRALIAFFYVGRNQNLLYLSIFLLLDFLLKYLLVLYCLMREVEQWHFSYWNAILSKSCCKPRSWSGCLKLCSQKCGKGWRKRDTEETRGHHHLPPQQQSQQQQQTQQQQQSVCEHETNLSVNDSLRLPENSKLTPSVARLQDHHKCVDDSSLDRRDTIYADSHPRYSDTKCSDTHHQHIENKCDDQDHRSSDGRYIDNGHKSSDNRYDNHSHSCSDNIYAYSFVYVTLFIISISLTLNLNKWHSVGGSSNLLKLSTTFLGGLTLMIISLLILALYLWVIISPLIFECIDSYSASELLTGLGKILSTCLSSIMINTPPFVPDLAYTRFIYTAVFLISFLISCLSVTNKGRQLLSRNRHFCYRLSSRGTCLSRDPSLVALSKICVSTSGFFVILCLLLLRTRSLSDPRNILQNGCWPLKIGLWIAIFALTFCLPVHIDVIWIYFALAATLLVVLLQGVFLLDITNLISRKLGSESQEERTRIFYFSFSSVTLFLYATAITAFFCFYIFFAQALPCKTNRLFMCINLVLCITASVISIHPLVANGGLVQSAVITTFCMYCTWSALYFNPREECNPLAHDMFAMDIRPTNIAFFLLETGLSTATLIYSSLYINRIQSFLEMFGLVFCKLNPLNYYKSRSCLNEIEKLPPISLVSALLGNKPNQRSESVTCSLTRTTNLPHRDKEDHESVDSSKSVPYNYSLFLLIHTLITLQTFMSLINWTDSTPGSHFKESIHWAIMCVKMVASSCCVLMYIWSLVSPLLLQSIIKVGD